MFISKVVPTMPDASVASPPILVPHVKRGKNHVTGFMLCLSLVTGWGFLPGIAHSAVNVSPSTPQLQAEFLASTTNQWLGMLFPNPFFAGTYSFNLTGKNPAYQPPVPVQPSVIFDSAAFVSLMNQAVKISSDTYAYGWANGMTYERQNELIALGGFYSLCNDTATFKTPNISSTTCQGVISTVSNFIYQMNFSTPVAAMGF